MKTMNYFRKIYVALLALAVSFSLNSCGNDDDDDSGSGSGGGGKLEVTLSSTELVPATGGEIKATVKAEGDWAVSNNQSSWVTFTPIRGSGDGEFTIRVAGHEAQTDRTATVTVSIDDTDIKQDITIKQDMVRAAFTMTDQGVFGERCKGVWYFWSDFAEPPVPSPALYYKHTVLKKGKLNIKFTNSHIHTFMMGKEPGYYEKTGYNAATGAITFPPREEPTVAMDEDLGGNAFAAVIEVDEAGKGGDVPALCPRSDAQDITFYLLPGTYWTTHTLEINAADPADDGTCATEGMPMFGLDDTFNLTITFTPDPDESE
jgi:hypothetical protein